MGEIQATNKSPLSATSPVQDSGTLKSLIESRIESIRGLMPKHLTADRVAKMAMIAVSKQPKLLQCTQVSVMRAIMQAAELGLDFSGTLGHGYMVPFKQECQFIPGYRGLIELARRGGEVLLIQSEVVYARDDFDIDYARDRPIHHKPYLGEGLPGEIVGVWAQAWLKDTPLPLPEFLRKSEIDKIRACSKAANDGPWVTWYGEQARKTAIKRLCKKLPLSTELARAIELDNEALGNIDGGGQVEADPSKSKAERLAERVAAAKAPALSLPSAVAHEPVIDADPHDTGMDESPGVYVPFDRNAVVKAIRNSVFAMFKTSNAATRREAQQVVVGMKSDEWDAAATDAQLQEAVAILPALEQMHKESGRCADIAAFEKRVNEARALCVA